MTKFTIIIPTRERADTLLHSLTTCVTEQYENLTIIVCDNFSKDNTYDIVQTFEDSRILYINPGKRLSMSENWEFALDHVKDGYVMFLGDDDGLMPGALSSIDTLIKQYGVKAVNWHSDQYLWPSFRFNKRANLLKVSLDDRVELLSGMNELQLLVDCKNGYERVPWIYKAFVEISLINSIKNISGTFFNSMIPDVYSGIALATVVDKYIYSYKPYTLDAISNHSNGASFTMVTKDKAAANEFLSETNIPIHSGFQYCQSAYLLTAECLYQAISHKIIDPRTLNIDLTKFFRAAMMEVGTEPHERYKNVTSSIEFTAAHFKISNKVILDLFGEFPNKPIKKTGDYNVEGFNKFKNRVEIKTNKYGVENVYDATLLHNKIRKDPSKFLTAAAIFSSTIKFIIREIQKRYF